MLTAADRPRLVLASASTGRLRLLRAAGIDPEVVVSGVDESVVQAADPVALVGALAEAKALAVAGSAPGSGSRTGSAAPESDGGRGSGPALVLGCDSALAFDGAVLGKPADGTEAERRWRRMAGGSGVLYTGHCLVSSATGTRFGEVSSALVRFGRPTEVELAAYIASGEPLRVAGAFTIDGLGGPFVDGIDGDPGTVIGLSLPVLRRLLARHGVPISALWSITPGAALSGTTPPPP